MDYPIESEEEYLTQYQEWIKEEEWDDMPLYIDPFDGKAKVMKIRLRGSIEWDQPYSIAKPVYDQWEFWVNSFNE